MKKNITLLVLALITFYANVPVTYAHNILVTPKTAQPGGQIAVKVALDESVRSYSLDLVSPAGAILTTLSKYANPKISTAKIEKDFSLPTSLSDGAYTVRFTSGSIVLNESVLVQKINTTPSIPPVSPVPATIPVVQTQFTQSVNPQTTNPTPSFTTPQTVVPMNSQSTMVLPVNTSTGIITTTPPATTQTVTTTTTTTTTPPTATQATVVNLKNFKASVTAVSGKPFTYVITWSGASTGINVSVPSDGFLIIESLSNGTKTSGIDLNGSSGSKEFKIIQSGDSFLPTRTYSAFVKSRMILGDRSAQITIMPYTQTQTNTGTLRSFNDQYKKITTVVVPRANPNVVTYGPKEPKAGDTIEVTINTPLPGDSVNDFALTVDRTIDIKPAFRKITDTRFTVTIPANITPGKYSLIPFSLNGGVGSGVLLDVKKGNGSTAVTNPSNDQPVSASGRRLVSANTMISDGYVLELVADKAFRAGNEYNTSLDKLILTDSSGNTVNLKPGRFNSCTLNIMSEKNVCFYLSGYDFKYTGQYFASVRTRDGYETNKLPITINHKTADGYYFDMSQDQVFQVGKKYTIKVKGFRGSGMDRTVQLMAGSVPLGGAVTPGEDSIEVTIPNSLRTGVPYELTLVNPQSGTSIAPVEPTARVAASVNSYLDPRQQRQVLQYPLKFLIRDDAFTQSTPTDLSKILSIESKKSSLSKVNDASGQGLRANMLLTVKAPVKMYESMYATVVVEDNLGNKVTKTAYGVIDSGAPVNARPDAFIDAGKSVNYNFQVFLPYLATIQKGRTYKVSVLSVNWFPYPERSQVTQTQQIPVIQTNSVSY